MEYRYRICLHLRTITFHLLLNAALPPVLARSAHIMDPMRASLMLDLFECFEWYPGDAACHFEPTRLHRAICLLSCSPINVLMKRRSFGDGFTSGEDKCTTLRDSAFDCFGPRGRRQLTVLCACVRSKCRRCS